MKRENVFVLGRGLKEKNFDKCGWRDLEKGEKRIREKCKHFMFEMRV